METKLADRHWSLRIGSGQACQRYPLPVQTATAARLRWLPKPHEETIYHAQLELPIIDKDSILIPSLCLLNSDSYRFQFKLLADNACYALNEVPSRKESFASANKKSSASTNDAVLTKIDCFHIQKRLSKVILTIEIASPQPPVDFLLTLSSRPLELEGVLDEQAMPLPETSVSTKQPSAFSQKLGPAKIKGQICSPTATAMVLDAYRPLSWLDFVAGCLDQATGMFGVWPLAIHQASIRGHLGAVEAFSDWTQALQLLQLGIPLVTSIRYGKDQLSGSPMQSTGGHLVVLYGVEGGMAKVCDPAAPDMLTVPRLYPLGEFTQSWLQHRGAVYILLP